MGGAGSHGNHPGGATRVNQVAGDSDMAAACVCELGEGGLNKGTVGTVGTSL